MRAFSAARRHGVRGLVPCIATIWCHPDATTARLHDVPVDVRSMKDDVRMGLSRLARVRETITTDSPGTPRIRGTRIPAHDVAEMLANGDGIEAIRNAWSVLAEEQIEAAALYARACPCLSVPGPPPERALLALA